MWVRDILPIVLDRLLLRCLTSVVPFDGIAPDDRAPSDDIGHEFTAKGSSENARPRETSRLRGGLH
jgi:hypothetical protein